MAKFFQPDYYQNHHDITDNVSRTILRQEYLFRDRDKFVTSDDAEVNDNERTITCDSKAPALRIKARVDAVDFEGNTYGMGDYIELEPGQFKQWYNIRHHDLPERTLPLDNLKGNDATVTIPSQTLPVENAEFADAHVIFPETEITAIGGGGSVTIPAGSIQNKIANTKTIGDATLSQSLLDAYSRVDGTTDVDGTPVDLENGRIAFQNIPGGNLGLLLPVQTLAGKGGINFGTGPSTDLTLNVSGSAEGEDIVIPEKELPVIGLDLSTADVTIPEQTLNVDGIDVENGTVTIPQLPVIPIIDVPQFQIRYECEMTSEGTFNIKLLSDQPVYLSSISFVDSFYNVENSWLNEEVEETLNDRLVIEPIE